MRSPLLLVFSLVVALGCSWPWREYPVSSGVGGTLTRSGEVVSSGLVRIQVRSAGNAQLGTHEVMPLGKGGRFAFDPLQLRVAGQEHSKDYLLLLTFRNEDHKATLWRADYSRLRLGGAIELSCDLDRPRRQGPPCQIVSDPRDQPWLIRAGRRDYRKLCASCHGPGGKGDGPDAAGLETSPADLTRITERHGGVFPREAIADWIDGRSLVPAHGAREMPAWGVVLGEQTVPGGFSEELIRNRIDILVLYLETLQQPATPPLTRPDWMSEHAGPR